MELFKRIGDRGGERTAAFNLGHAYKNILGLRDLDQAERWYRRDLELNEAHDTLGRARSIGQLGSIDYQRFLDDRRARRPVEQLARHLARAAGAYEEALQLLPADAVADLAVVHHQLAAIYGEAGNSDVSLEHYRQSLHYEEQQDNQYGAGQSRYSAAVELREVGRNREALLFARAALRDFQAVGPGATANADAARQLIALLEQEPSQ
jgi:tetratricopeptide (TPR) repeat protein